MQQASPRRRATALLLALVAHFLVILMLLRQVPPPRMAKIDPRPMTFQMLPDRMVEPTKSKSESGEAAQRPAAPRPTPDAPAIETPVAAPPSPLNMIILSRQDFAAADISKLTAKTNGVAPAGAGASARAGKGKGTETGPGGEPLHDAQWYRKPTDAELAYYVRPGAPPTGWGLIACQTVARYKVENCQELGESPRGSGLARSVREAAWQFLVLPPRVGGRPMVGAWVRIRIDYTKGVPK